MEKIKVVDFFSGCGGTSAGLQTAGMEILAGIDVDKDAGETFEQNFPTATFFTEDIAKFRTSKLRALIPIQRKFPLLFSACAPCQPFTKQNTIKNLSDSRYKLLDNLHRFIKTYTPEYIFLENVPGIQKTITNSPLDRFHNLLEKLCYNVQIRVIRSQNYGIPQRRSRLVLLASQPHPISFPTATHGPETDNDYVTVWESISDLPELTAGGQDDQVKNHRCANLSDINLERIRATPVGGSRLDWPDHLVLECHKDYRGHTDVYGRMHKDQPASGLTTRCISLSNGRFGHPTQNRAISVREAARLQTFPDDFVFSGSLNSMAKQIGNAVPVSLATIFGAKIIEHLTSTVPQGAEVDG